LAFTPNNNPTICKGNVVDLGCYVRSYFNNYTYYKWQKSSDNGLTYTDVSAAGTASPVWNGSAYEYYVTYPSFVAAKSDSGKKYRVVVASTVTNITNVNCSFSDVASILTLNVIDCGTPLQTDIISFSGKIDNNEVKLNWTTNKEANQMQYIIERSMNGRDFVSVATVNSKTTGSEINYYSWSESYKQNSLNYYRIRLLDNNNQKISRTLKLSTSDDQVSIATIINPFNDKLIADINVADAQLINLQLIDNFGKIIRKQQYSVTGGSNRLQLDHTESLPQGMYIVQLQSSNTILNKKVMKQ
jgi:hypothetical protein